MTAKKTILKVETSVTDGRPLPKAETLKRANPDTPKDAPMQKGDVMTFPEIKPTHQVSEGVKSAIEEMQPMVKHEVKDRKGLGDAIDEFFKSPAVAPVTNIIKSLIWKDGEDCGCDERKEKLNKLPEWIRRNKPLRCLIEDDYNAIKDIVPNITAHVQHKDMAKIAKAHASVFNYHFTGVCSSCTAVNRGIIKDMKLILKEYNND